MAKKEIWFSITNVRQRDDTVEVLLEGGVMVPEAREMLWILVEDSAYKNVGTDADKRAKWIEAIYGRISKALEKNRKILGKLDESAGLVVKEVLIQYS